ncbi:hypothetical protein OPS25_05630 [Alteromonas ponticola]|uniref:DUF3570 domain-containing protein n=1 Tax=Alteromonas aquimaris TaxID=2998417 RepID=A0ABT3P5D0_9ALTE|nr:hypothetical protein [Alteromonas aquimaris]MCW8107973.1 hypothetical protein [Alteromonas aquimaris]
MSCLILLFCSSLAVEDTTTDAISQRRKADAEAKTHEIVRPALQDSVENSDASWFDRWQQNLTHSMDYTARQLDSFFAVQGSDAYKDARAEGRVRLGWEPRTRDMSELDLKFRVRVKLPALKDRVDLLLSDNDDYEEEDTINAVRDQALSRRDSTTIALRFKQADDSSLSHRIGTGRRGQIYLKSRYRDTYAFNQHWSLQYDAEAYYYTRDEFGAEVGASFQHVNETDHVFRFNNRYYYRDTSEDWMWRHELQFLQPLTDDSAVIYNLFTEGFTKPGNRLDQYYISARYRTNPHREWLFYEVEPFVLWLREEDFKPSYGLAMRIEVYYGKYHL